MRPEKQSIVEELKSKIGDSTYVILTNYRGLTVSKTEELRRRLRKVSARFQVIQNSMLRRAVKDVASVTGLGEQVEGPSAMVFGKGDVVQAAKVLKDFRGEFELPVVRAGALEGAILSAAQIDELAGLPPREVLLGRFVGTVAAPLSRLVGVLQQKVATVVYVLKAAQEKKEKQTA